MSKLKIDTEFSMANAMVIQQILSESPAKMADLSRQLSRDQLSQPLGEGERSYLQTVVHIINCEARVTENIYAALLLKEPHVLKIHPERQYGQLLRFEQFPLADLIAYFKLRRAALSRVLTELTERRWKHVIVEASKQRRESVYLLCRGMALHEYQHILDLEFKTRH